jgi:hypothetical protein
LVGFVGPPRPRMKIASAPAKNSEAKGAVDSDSFVLLDYPRRSVPPGMRTGPPAASTRHNARALQSNVGKCIKQKPPPGRKTGRVGTIIGEEWGSVRQSVAGDGRLYVKVFQHIRWDEPKEVAGRHFQRWTYYTKPPKSKNWVFGGQYAFQGFGPEIKEAVDLIHPDWFMNENASVLPPCYFAIFSGRNP